MDIVAVIAGAVLGVVFLVAGASKVAAGDDWPREAHELGAPRLVVPVLPWFEIVLGALLVAQVWRPVTAAVAALVLVAFTVVILRRLREGRHPPCACFGRWSARPLGAGHVVRNVLLLLVAAVAVLA